MDKNKRIYISGPMTGIPEENIPAFIACKEKLQELGYKNVVLPHELFTAEEHRMLTYWQKIRRDVAEMAKCDIVITLEGWTESRGANIEINAARGIRLPVISAYMALRNAKEKGYLVSPDYTAVLD